MSPDENQNKKRLKKKRLYIKHKFGIKRRFEPIEDTREKVD